MTNYQLDLFPGGEDTPLFSGTPIRAKVEPFQPREATSPTRLFVCPTCQDTERVMGRGRSKTSGYCPGLARQVAKSRMRPETLPESTKTKTLREEIQIDNPARRLTTQGPQALTLVELLSFVLGTPNDPLVASQLLAELKTLPAIKARSVKELAALGHGMTVERARRLLAALELGDRMRLPREERPVIKSPADAAALLVDMATLEQEQMRVIVLDTKNQVIHTVLAYQGSVHTTVIRVGELMKAAVRMNATAFVIAHNHPSGDPTPSPEDVAVTREIVQAAKLLDIDCLDHIVIGESGRFLSLKERGLGF